MKAHLLFADRDPDISRNPLETQDDLVRDLDIGTVLAAMGGEDPFLHDFAAHVLLSGVPTVDDVQCRQQILTDCFAHPHEIQGLYDLAEHATQTKQRVRAFFMGDYPSGVLARSVALLRDLTDDLEQLRLFSAIHAHGFTSPGLRTFFAMIDRDLNEAYLATLRDHLRRLDFPNGVFMTAHLDDSCQGTDYVLRKPVSIRRSWGDLFGLFRRQGVYTYRIPERDENGARTLSRLRDYGINQVANAAAQSADRVLDFFLRLRWELGFYLGALHLHQRLRQAGAPVCLPIARPAEDMALTARNLCDVGLVLRGTGAVVGNDLDADGKTLVMVTGAKEGGTTFLRSLGLAQLMMQAGLFVAADAYTASVTSGILTHYRREEDAEMTSGKLDEELQRMSQVADQVQPQGLVLFNESFACANEREGSEIARTIVHGLQDSGVRVAYVTHMYDLSSSLARRARASDLLLRAERRADGRRTFKIIRGEPEPTSYGRDLYEEIFAR